jgi:hypothetical protein
VHLQKIQWSFGTFLVTGLLVGAVACSSSTSSPGTPAAGDAAVAETGADGAPLADAAATDSATADSAMPTGKGLTIANATNASLDGTYDIQVVRASVTGGFGYNGNFDGKIELEVDTDTAGVVKAAHVWNYTGGPMNAMPDKFYGCDGQTKPCTGVTVDVTTNLITITPVTWPEVQAISFDGSADKPVAGGGTVTVSGIIQATL